MSQQPQPGEIWRHRNNCDEVLFIGRDREGTMVWQARSSPLVQVMDFIDWAGWELVSVAVPQVRAGWLSKGCDGIYWHEAKPSWDNHYQWWCCNCKNFEADGMTDPWPDKPDGGAECILEVK